MLLVERENIGGDCTHSGCVPSKAMIHAAHQMKSAREAHKFCKGGQVAQQPLVADLALVREHVQASVSSVYELEGPDVLQSQGVHVWKGDAVFETLGTLKITMGDGEVRTVSTKKVCVATGAGPKTPSIKGIESVKYWNYLNVWEQTVLPARLAVVGAGPIGSELAQAFARLGSEVTLFASKILPRESEDARVAVLQAFKEDGMKHVSERPVSVSQEGAHGKITIATSAGATEFDALLVATGRSPVVPDGLQAAGAQLDPRGGVLVDKYLQVKGCGSKVYAVGDCIAGNYQFTHLAGTQGFTAARNALLPSKSVGAGFAKDGLNVCPRVTFTDPEIGAAGFATAKDADVVYGAGYAEEHTIHGEHIDRAVCEGAQKRTSLTLVIGKKSGAVLGGRYETRIFYYSLFDCPLFLFFFKCSFSCTHPHPHTHT